MSGAEPCGLSPDLVQGIYPSPINCNRNPMKKRWNLSPVNKELVETLVSELDILPVTAQLLINRGLVDCDKAFSFLSPDMSKLHDPFLMKDMDLATSLIIRAIDLGEQIAVYGDFDVDGATASALLYLFFEKVGVKIISYIPDRKSEGYGLNKKALQRLRGQGVGLVITVDCGTSNSEEIEFARTIGLDVIVTDHHEVPLDGGPKASATEASSGPSDIRTIRLKVPAIQDPMAVIPRASPARP